MILKKRTKKIQLAKAFLMGVFDIALKAS